jgi:uncharacterized tellurite resistance protein B-like protein
MAWYWWILVISLALIMLVSWGANRKKKSKGNSLNSMFTLNYLMMSVDGEIDEYEQRSLIRYWRKLLLEDDQGDWFADWYDDEGDVRTDKLMDLTKEIEGRGYNFAHTDTELDESIFPIIDILAKSIRSEHRQITINALVSLCGADLEWHPNEVKLIEYIAKKIKIKKKVLKNLIESSKELIEQAIQEVEESRKKKELWAIAIQKVSIPGWKEETARFMSELYEEDLDILLSTSDSQVAKDVPSITPAKAKVLKKQMSS